MTRFISPGSKKTPVPISRVNVWENSALLESGTKTVPLKDLFYGLSNGAQGSRFGAT